MLLTLRPVAAEAGYRGVAGRSGLLVLAARGGMPHWNGGGQKRMAAGCGPATLQGSVHHILQMPASGRHYRAVSVALHQRAKFALQQHRVGGVGLNHPGAAW